MSRLVQPQLAPPRQSQLRQPPPSGFGDSRERGTLGGQLSHGCVQVVAHQVQLVYRRGGGGGHGELGGRKLEDQPAGAGIDVRVVEHVSKEGTVGFGVAAVDDDVATIDHAGSVLVGRRGPAGAAAISGGVPGERSPNGTATCLRASLVPRVPALRGYREPERLHLTHAQLLLGDASVTVV